ncbi:helix-turn-helix transcriptional regulator [Devosia sp. Leaf64]|uniref:helix-turn-helix domain-containing protein n=1 Tax=Devosia sp. Leaf64 TaxID=1736229 RepID=UPI000712E30A|nr:helix-turn-helix transcriptional regulator [Devosia sp. Leaf64]KQN74797.1 XRE family transcriptional regulator [Devosia sp. Leaf64]
MQQCRSTGGVKRNHPDDLRETFARNLRLLRAEKGMSQETLAFESGVNRTYVSDVERGIRNISLDNISRLAKALDVPAWTLLKGDLSP